MPFPLNNKLVPPVWVESGGKYKKLYEDAEVQVSLLQGQLAQSEAALVIAQADLATAQAQIVQDAATISSLQGQVTALTAQVASLNSQITALQAQLDAYKSFGVFFVGPITEVGGGIYVPPSWDNPVVSIDALKASAPIITITTTGGGYP